MIVAPDKTQCTTERLAIENGFLIDNLKMNCEEIKKRQEELKKLDELYEFELKLRKSRKKFAFEIKKIDDQYEDIEPYQFIKDFIKDNKNEIKEYTKIYDFILVKLKYNQIIETKEWCLPHFLLRQMDPCNILKKNKNNYINNINIK